MIVPPSIQFSCSIPTRVVSFGLCLQTRNNAVAWNPMEAFNFTVANEDCNLYSYDMRKLSIASCVHQVSTIPPS